MALTIGELVGFIDLDASGARRGVGQAEAAMQGLQRSTDGRLRDMRGRFVAESAAMGAYLGDGLGRAAQRTRSSLGGLRGVLGTVTAATGALAGGAAAAGGALVAIPALFAGIGIKAAASSQEVRDAFSGLKEHVTSEVQGMAGPISTQLVKIAGDARETFDQIAPSLGAGFKAAAPQIRSLAQGVLGAVESLAPALARSVSVAAPVIEAVSGGLVKLSSGIAGVLEGIGSGAQGAAVGLSGLFAGISRILPALGQLIGQLAQAGGPVLSAFLGALASLVSTLAGALGPALAQLGPPLTRLITALGSGLQPIAAALGPVLSATAGALGQLVAGIAPLLPMVGRLAATLLPALTPILATLGTLFRQLAPVVQQLAATLAGALAPALSRLPAVVAPLVGLLTRLASGVLPLWSQWITALTPALATLGQALSQLLVALGPLLTASGQLVGILRVLTPVFTPLIALVGKLASVLATVLAAQITHVTIPALKILTSLLRGDFSGAWQQAKALVANVGNFLRSLFSRLVVWAQQGIAGAVRWIATFPGRAQAALAALTPRLQGAADQALLAFQQTVRAKSLEVVAFLRGLPARMSAALGSLGGLLVGQGRDVVRGLLAGIRSMGSWLRSSLSSWAASVIPGPIAKALGIGSPSKVMAREVGRWIPAGVAAGITSGQGAVEGAMRRLVPVPAGPPVPGPSGAGSRYGRPGSSYGSRSGPLLHIDNWHAGTATPDQTAAALAWKMKARG